MISILGNILIIYGVVMGIIMLRLGLAMLFELDRYDWGYNKEEIWMGFVLFPLLWPVSFLKLKEGLLPLLFHPADFLRDTSGCAHPIARARMADALENGARLCSDRIVYENDQMVFEIESSEMADIVHSAIAEKGFEPGSDESTILVWLRNTDPQLPGVTIVPEYWDQRFRYLMLRAWENNKGQVTCKRCGVPCDTGMIRSREYSRAKGYYYCSYLCPKKHTVLDLMTSYVHFYTG